MVTRHCQSCRCYDGPSPAVSVGDRVVDRFSGVAGVVQFTQSANPPWHSGGTPFVRSDEPSKSGYWYYYEKETP